MFWRHVLRTCLTKSNSLKVTAVSTINKMIAFFLVVGLTTVWWIFKTGYHVKN